jgi:hypothetical protein
MPKEKPFKLDIKAFYKANAEDLLLFAFISGVQHFLPAIQTKTLVESFKEQFNLSEEDYPSDCAIQNFQTMKKRFLNERFKNCHNTGSIS